MLRPALLAFLAAASLAHAGTSTLQVLDQRWGVDGFAVPGRINLLSLEIANVSTEPFDGVLALRKTLGLGMERGAPLIQPCYLSPGAARWVQFYPYARYPHEEWVLQWGRGLSERVPLKSPKMAPPGRAILQDPDDPLPRVTRFPTLLDVLFPPTVAATDGIHSLVVDHVPKWAPAQKQALLDWLRRGGELHVLHDRNGRHPTFPGDLAELNAPLDRFRVGAGLVVRHSVGRHELSEGQLRDKGFPEPKLDEDYNAPVFDLEQTLFQQLAAMTRPKHNWALIYVTAIAYILVIGPGNYLYGRNRREYRLTLLVYFLAVAACAWLLGTFGRRGHGEATTVHSIATARHLGGDDYDVAQWVNAFVVRGAFYEIAHDAPHNLYSTCQDDEAVNGSILNGKDGRFIVDIPLYSARAFLHRGKLKGHPLKLDAVRWQGEEALEALALACKDGLPPGVKEMWVLHRNSFYPLSLVGDHLEAQTQSRRDAEQFLREHPPQLPGYGLGADDDDKAASPEKRFQYGARLLIARAVGAPGAIRQRFSLPPSPSDRVQIFILAEAPESFRIQGDRFGRKMGYVLYHLDLFKGGPSAGSPPAGG